MSGVVGFDHWTLLVSDLERATGFYRDVLGWHPLDTTPVSDDTSWGALPGREPRAKCRRFVRDGQRIELMQIAGSGFRPRRPQVNHLGLSHMTVATGETDDVIRTLQALNVTVRSHTRSSFVPGLENPGNQFLFEDPDGNIIETYESGDDWNSFGIGGAEPPDYGGVGHLSHWSLCVKDPATAIPFYRDVLGWSEIAVLDWLGEGPSTVMDVGPARLTTWLLGATGQRIEIIHFTAPPVRDDDQRTASVTGLSHMTVTIEDIESAREHLALGGAEPSTARGERGASLLFHDPDGNLIRGIPEDARWR